MAGMLKAFAGEAIGNPELEVEGTVAKLVNRVEMNHLARERARGVRSSNEDARPEPESYDVTLHARAARHLELAAQNHRRALRCHRSGKDDDARYYAFIAQGFFSEASAVTTQLGKILWRNLENRR